MRRRYPSRRLTATLTAALAIGWLPLAIPMDAAAAVVPPIDFGTVGVGNSATAEYTMPLDFALSEMASETVLYEGGDPFIDSFLASEGITVPVTAGSLYAEIGEVTATYHLTLALVDGTSFSISAPNCATGTESCAVTVTFAPTAEGSFADTVQATIFDLVAVGPSEYASLIDFITPTIVGEVEPELAVQVGGTASTGTSGLELRVSVAPEAAPCVLLDATDIDFGTLPFSTEAVLSEGSAGANVSSCSTGSQALHSSGTDATGNGTTPALWTLSATGGNPCPVGVTAYGVALGTDGSGGMPATFQLSTLSSSWIVMPAGSSVASSVDYQMPCVGSDGAGQTMSSQVTFLATVP